MLPCKSDTCSSSATWQLKVCAGSEASLIGLDYLSPRDYPCQCVQSAVTVNLTDSGISLCFSTSPLASSLLQSVTQSTVIWQSSALRVRGCLLSGLCPPPRSQRVDCSHPEVKGRCDMCSVTSQSRFQWLDKYIFWREHLWPWPRWLNFQSRYLMLVIMNRRVPVENILGWIAFFLNC